MKNRIIDAMKLHQESINEFYSENPQSQADSMTVRLLSKVIGVDEKLIAREIGLVLVDVEK